jgi:hypothetical protein
MQRVTQYCSPPPPRLPLLPLALANQLQCRCCPAPFGTVREPHEGMGLIEQRGAPPLQQG